MRMVPRGHLSMHPTALEIAGSSISISPVLPLDAPLPFPRPFSHAPAAADPAAAGRQWSSSSSMLDPPSSFPYRPIPRSSNSRSSSHISSSSSSTATSVAAEPRPAHLLSTTTPSSLPQPQDFLQKRRAQAAAHYLRPDDENMDAIFKRRAQVDYAVGRAKERIAQLGLKCPSKKHHGKGCMANLRRQIQMIKDNPFWGLWGEQLKEIEGSFGSAVMITFAFLRWVFFLNVCLSMLWIGAIVIPFFLHPPSSYQWTGIKQYFQANGLEKTWILFGGYIYKSEQTGWYRTDYVYPCTIAVMFLISLVAILAT